MHRRTDLLRVDEEAGRELGLDLLPKPPDPGAAPLREPEQNDAEHHRGHGSRCPDAGDGIPKGLAGRGI